jgi:hypothetical protein
MDGAPLAARLDPVARGALLALEQVPGATGDPPERTTYWNGYLRYLLARSDGSPVTMPPDRQQPSWERALIAATGILLTLELLFIAALFGAILTNLK